MAKRTWRLYFPKVVIRLGLLAFVALGLQLMAMYAPLGPGDVQRRALFVLSYVLLLGFVLVNLRRPGIVIIGVGLLLNFIVMASNGGLMPVTAETLGEAGTSRPEISPGEWVPNSKDVLLERDDIRLRSLSDTLVFTNFTGVEAFSPGDVIIGAGLVVTLGELLLPRLQRVGPDRPAVT